MTNYDKQIAVENKFSKQNIVEWILTELDEDLSTNTLFLDAVALIEAHLDRTLEFYSSKRVRYMQVKTHKPFHIAFEIFKAILSSTTDVMPVQAVATTIGLNFHKDQLSAVKTGAELLGVIESLDLFTISAGSIINDENVSSFLTKNYSLSKETLNKIHATQYLPPMLVEPLAWADNISGGTIIHNSSCILGNGNNHSEKQSLDVLNILQAIPWKFTSMLDQQEPSAKSQQIGESDSDYRRKVIQHNGRSAQSKYIYDLFSNQDQFYFVWKFCKRGRQYSQGYDINLQGSEYKKSIIEFAHEELITGV